MAEQSAKADALIDELVTVGLPADGVVLRAIEIGSHEGPAWSRADLEADKFQTSLNLGDAAFPGEDTSGFCEHAGALNDHLYDTDLLNEDLLAWQELLTTALEDLEGDGIAFLLKGEQVVGEELHEVITDIRPLTKVLGFNFSLRFIQNHTDAANDLMPGIWAEQECSGYWLPLRYE